MLKTIHLIRGNPEESYSKFMDRVLSGCREVAKDENVKALTLTITSKRPPVISIIPFKKNKVAAISLYQENNKREDYFLDWNGFSGTFLVEEAIPVAYGKTWIDGEKIPGINLLTLFRKKRTIDHSTFIHRWHHSHTPLSLRLHPLWNYNRNVVVRNITKRSEHWDGIVMEQFRYLRDLLNPVRFFGNPLTMLYHMIEVYIDIRSFLDHRTVEPYFADEYCIKTHSIPPQDVDLP